MKHKELLLLLCIAILFPLKALAQLPEVSTAENPVWYFIQVVGADSNRENRVFVAKDGYLYGEALNKSSNAQLFRFEKSGNQYFIISKSTNQKLDVGMNGTEEALKLSASGIGFTLDPLAGVFFNITASSTPTGGDASKKWAHQANSNSSYKIILVSTTWSSGANSQFSFIPYEALNLEYSTTGNDVWYTIQSAKTGNNDMYMTDVQNGDGSRYLSLTSGENTDSQYWKLVKKGTLTQFVNKATGNVLQTKSDLVDPYFQYNFTQLTQDAAQSKGWSLTHIRGGQYAISGVEEDNITRYLSASNTGNNTPEELNLNDNLYFSSFAWKLTKADGDVSIPVLNGEENTFYAYPENRKIKVVGADEYSVRTIQGVLVDKDSTLPVGIYLVTANGKTVKVLVK